MAKNNIKSWESFAAHSVSLEFHICTEGYVPSVTIFLDDGQKPSDDQEKQKVITIITDTILKKTNSEILAFARGMRQLFNKVDSIILLVSEDGETTEEIDLETLVAKETSTRKPTFY